MKEIARGIGMPRFIRVTKDNHMKDRGFIAVDAICAVFENQNNHNTEIMTMDGFWYEVVDGIDKVYADVTGDGGKPRTVAGAERIPKATMDAPTDKLSFAKKRRFSYPAVSEDSAPKSHEETRWSKRSGYAYPKTGYGVNRHRRDMNSHQTNFPSGEGEGQNGSRTKAVEFAPPET